MTARLSAGLAVVRVNGSEIPLASEPRCRVCSSTERAAVEAGLLGGRTYEQIVRSIPGGCGLSVRNISEHLRNDHLPVEAAAIQVLRDEQAGERGREITPVAEAVADRIVSGIPLAKAIVAKVGQRLATTN